MKFFLLVVCSLTVLTRSSLAIDDAFVGLSDDTLLLGMGVGFDNAARDSCVGTMLPPLRLKFAAEFAIIELTQEARDAMIANGQNRFRERVVSESLSAVCDELLTFGELLAK